MHDKIDRPRISIALGPVRDSGGSFAYPEINHHKISGIGYFRAMAFLHVKNISRKDGPRYSLQDIDFVQNPYQKIAIAGETGSGKTTLLKIIAGLLQPDKGEILFQGKKVAGPADKLIPGHPAIAYLSQHFELRNNYRVEEELESGNRLGTAAGEIYSICRISHLLKRRTDQLSGGERQRIVLAKLLTTSPELLLLDEPFSNLDAIHRNIIRSVIDDIGDRLKISCIMVLHEAPDLLAWADTVFVMKEGKIIQRGEPSLVYRQPLDRYCAGLLGEYNLLDAELLPFAGKSIPPGKKILVRPEDLIPASAGEGDMEGIVQKIIFWGAYYTADVLVNGQLIRIRISHDRVNKGDKIYLALSGNCNWYIDA